MCVSHSSNSTRIVRDAVQNAAPGGNLGDASTGFIMQRNLAVPVMPLRRNPLFRE